ncbi:MAG: hypothetical protein IM504_07275 [Microcystis sp. M038S2]|uniref:nSTAND1 domain-containing NTPase n=1 Tax=unclassified Microcystis TaxID=2643300 RepID=UPI0025851827|nr:MULTISPECIES: hypothetical protein [unclassified Microcystis]MCA2683350.1 hypothetical protein [Microcystis sp. M046S2]MCA2704684.1 hypothetical protein [Microcystis sp. M038S2]
MNENQAGKNLNIEGGVQAVAGENLGTVNQYISIQKSEIEITNQPLITGSPYLGLRKFEVDDKDRFFGRDNWIIELTDYLKPKNVLLLLGASGSGKSSLVQAGLIPKLKDDFGANRLVNLTFVPDVNPFESFYGCLLANRYKQSQAKLAQAVKEDTLIKVVEGLKNNSDLWFIFIDQFEELFTRTPKTERDIFIKSLIKLIEKNNSLVKIVMTMRADFLDKLSPYPSLGKIHDQYSKMLTDMDESQLRLAIAEPAARNGVIFEQGLINQIVADFYERAGSLPLLQYTLDLLWEKDHIQERVLNIKIYQEIGGVTGALEKQADKIYSQFNEQQRKAAEEIFLELISLEGEKVVSRRADKSSFEQEEMQREVLYQLIDNRLLVSKGEDGKATVEVAHEALLRSWKVLQDLIREKEEIIVLRSRLYADAKQWDDLQKQDAVKASSELWGGSKLKRIVNLIKEKSLSNLDDVAVKFIKASYHYQKQREKIEAERKRREVDTELSLANSLSGYSLHLFNEEGKELDAIVEAIKAGKILQKHNASNTKAIDALQKILVEGRESNRLVGHNDGVWSVSFSPDGKTLATGSEDKTIKLWNVETGEEIGTLSGHNGSVYSVSFSSDGKTLATGSEDKTIKLWNVETGEEIGTLTRHPSSVYSVSFSSDGKTLATGSYDGTIKLWNGSTGQEIRTLSGPNDIVWSVSFSPDGKTLATGSEDNTIKLWDVETGQEIRTLSGHNDYVLSVSFSPDGKTLATGSEDKTIKLWNVETGQEIGTLRGHNGIVLSVSFSSDGKTLATGSRDNTIKLWNVETGQKIRTLSGHKWSVNSVSFSRDGKKLATGSGILISFRDNTIKLWNVETGQEIRTLPLQLYENTGHNKSVTSVSFSPDGKTLATGSGDNTIKLWNVETGQEIRTLTGHNSNVNSVSFSPDGKTLATGSDDGTIKLWDVETGQEILALTGHNSNVNSVSFSPDGKTLASGSEDTTIKLWNVETGKEIGTLKGHNDVVRSVSFSSDGKTLASGSKDKTIKLWNVETGKEIRTLTGHNSTVTSVSFSPDGKTLATGSHDKTIKLWNGEYGWGLDGLMGRSCDWVRVYLQNNINVREEDRHLCDGISTKN